MIISKLTAQLTLCLLFLLLRSAVPSGKWTSGEDGWLTKSTIHFLLPDLDRKQTFLIKSICFLGILAAENLPTAEFFSPSPPLCERIISGQADSWEGTVWILFLMFIVSLYTSRAGKSRAVGAEEREEWQWFYCSANNLRM